MSAEIIILGQSMVTAATFFLIPTIGEIFAERSGVLNLGIDGMLLTSAAASFGAAYLTNNLAIGVLVGMIGGGLLALIHAILTITFRVNQVISGIGITIFGTGLSGLVGLAFVGKKITPFPAVPIPLLSQIPILGPIFFNQDILVYTAFILAIAFAILLYKTRLGIIVRTTGENPYAAYSQGFNVVNIRYACVIIGGVLCGLGGAYLSLAWIPLWSEGITKGRGWIVIALTVVALWNPIGALLGSYVFGTFHVLQYQFQPMGIPTPILNMLPYLATIFLLAFWGIVLTTQKVKQVLGAPSALGMPFEPV
ncbi:MAG: ABC transporter permease [Candidatus Hodarchaeota archaeon]